MPLGWSWFAIKTLKDYVKILAEQKCILAQRTQPTVWIFHKTGI